MRRLVKWYLFWCKKQAAAHQAKESTLRQQLQTHHERLQTDPLNTSTQRTLASILEELKAFETWRAEGQRVHSRIN
jgi:hypothetical protein